MRYVLGLFAYGVGLGGLLWAPDPPLGAIALMVAGVIVMVYDIYKEQQ